MSSISSVITALSSLILHPHPIVLKVFSGMLVKGNLMKVVNRILSLLFVVTALLISGIPSSISGQEAGTIVITEFLTSNNTSLLDPDFFQYADWIEIYNKGTSAIDLGGSYLTDNLSNPKKWQTPTGTVIQAGQYLLFWADGTDESGNGLHTNFKLNKGGDAIGLFNKDRLPIDTLSYGNQIADVSYGRSSASPSNWLYFPQPTPGAANTTTGFDKKKQSAPPVISLASGFYSGSRSVTLSDPAGGTIRYTLDGSTPTEQSMAYGAPLAVTGNTVLKARVYEPDRLPGPVLTRTYFINEHTTLPVISLTTDPDNLWSNEIGIYNDRNIADRKEWERPAHIELFETNGRSGFSIDADIRLFGRTAIYIPEKSLGIFPTDPLDYPLFGADGVQKFYSFVLRSSSDDWHLTMFRDAFIHTMIRQNLVVDTQNYRPAILFINGEYWGIHNIREKYNEDYLAVHHGADPNNVDLIYIDARTQGGIEVLAGDAEQYNALIDFVENNNLASQANYDRVASMVDIDNFVDYVIAEALTGNSSWAHNIRQWCPRTNDGKWQWLVFDMDRGFRTQSYNALQEMSQMLPLFRGLLENQNFRQMFLQRFAEYLNGGLRQDRITAIIDSLQAGIAAEIPRHSERWKNECGNGVCGIPSLTSWQESVATMRSIAEERPGIVRQQIIDLFNLDGTVPLDIQVTPFGFGTVRLGKKTSISQKYLGTFFTNTTVDLVAQANDGYLFEGWREASSTARTLLNRGAAWKYFDNGTFPGATWNSPGFDDSTWKTGNAQLGYGDGDEATVVSYGPSQNNKYITTYFRTTFQVADISNLESLTVKLLRDDGAVVYLNGHEVVRANMPGGTIDNNTFASASVGGDEESTFFEFSISPDDLTSGTNTLAVEVHQYDTTSSDISFDLELDGFFAENGSSSYLSNNPELHLQLDQNHTLIAVFTANTQNQLPAEINQNTILTAANSPYIALSDLAVRPNVSLSIEPGAEIQLVAGASIYVNGQFSANGSEDLPVTIRGIGANGRWGALCFENATGQSSLSHLKIDGATTGADAVRFKAAVSTYNSDITLDDVTMRNVGQPFYGRGGTIVITNSSLDGTGAGDDIINIQYASARVENCHLFGNGELDFDSVNDGIIRNNRIDIISTNSNRDGIDIGASENVLIENNRVFDCPDKGISVGEKSIDTIIRGNLVVNTSMAVAVKDSSTATIDRNTFYDDSVGVACYEKVANQGGGFAEVRNTIFAKSKVAEASTDGKSTIRIDYSLSDKSQLPGTGNIFGDPRFENVAENNFYLHPGSPCIDAGDPSSPNDPDGTRADIGAFFFNTGPGDFSNIYINELMASNTKTLVDNAGDYDDWIEIYNKGDFPVDLAGLYMTDDFSTPDLWVVPSGYPDSTMIQPGHFLLIWADAEVNQGVLHAGFKLNAAGEQVALVRPTPDGFTFVDSISFGQQADDVSYGRAEDGGPSWKTFTRPTPGAPAETLSVPPSEDSPSLPKDFVVYQNYPNPFNPSTTLVFDLPRAAKVTVDIFNVIGRRVARLMEEEKQAGHYQVEWRGLDDAGHPVTSGVYFYKISAGKWTGIRKMVLMR
jgi:hypothetical protein